MPADGFRIADHTADVGIEATGPDIKTLFENAARGLFAVVADPAYVEPRNAYTIEATANFGSSESQ